MAQDTEAENKPDDFSDDDKLMFSEQNGSTEPSAPWYTDNGMIAAMALTVIWFLIVVDYVVSSGWWSARFEMTPPEFMSFIAGALSPFAFIWIAAVYFSSQRKYVKEAGRLRDYIFEFTHPNAKNKLYVKSFQLFCHGCITFRTAKIIIFRFIC